MIFTWLTDQSICNQKSKQKIASSHCDAFDLAGRLFGREV